MPACSFNNRTALLHTIAPAHQQCPVEMGRPSLSCPSDCFAICQEEGKVPPRVLALDQVRADSVPATFTNAVAATTRDKRGGRAAAIFVFPHMAVCGGCHLGGGVTLPFFHFSLFPESLQDFSNFVTSDYYCYYVCFVSVLVF